MIGDQHNPDVQRLLRRDDQPEFTPPSFERWLGRLQMLRTLASMVAFLLVWVGTYESGLGWEAASVRGIVAAIVFHFFAWAVGLFVFGELYDIEVKQARSELEERERDRARRIEEYYRDRLRAQGLITDDGSTATPASAGPGSPPTRQVPAVRTSAFGQAEPERRAA